VVLTLDLQRDVFDTEDIVHLTRKLVDDLLRPVDRCRTVHHDVGRGRVTTAAE
jgi:hypothetical protein